MSATAGLFITSLLAFTAIYLFASLAALISERSGVVNIAIDGKMIIGALTFSLLYQSEAFVETFGNATPYVALIIAGFAGLAYSVIFSFSVINLMGDQVIVGTALNLFAPAFALLVIKTNFGVNTLTGISTSANWAGPVNTFAIIMVIVAFIVVGIAWVILNKTSFGLHLRSAGENPLALETSGYSVYKMRWISLSIAGFLAGMAGALFPVALGAGSFSGTVNGSGYIAITILIIGQWKIWGITLASMGFAVLAAFAAVWLSITDVIAWEIINILPFLIPLIILVVIKKTDGPLAAGKPYRKDMR